ncbi:uncharacterized protein SAPINGB_P003068 [Magnusiomyces paraingens]|uniref:GDT1 family protein n=1 Tax=Magnusiomyces paraingens TaxID=2606893 RepID=A0A5E8BRJ2_9ASCO|nr:uncharacterized protein SAPINGB_P003068 [Saprochaete ingens]VVT51353.1 unnamed protein product [Saprochaete ingens]
MRLSSILWTLLATSAIASPAKPTKPEIAISKGTEVITPGSKEAEALTAADKASKFAPKDNTFVENFDKGNTFKKSEPKLSDQKIDVPDNESLSPNKNKKKVAATKENKNPVVVNDYDPNNMGVSSEGKTKAQEHVDKDSEAETSEHQSEASVGDTESSKKPVEGTPDQQSSDSNVPIISSDGSINVDSSSSSSLLSSSTEPSTELKTQERNSEASDRFHALVVSISMTIMSEIGDKTFLIAAIMAMKHNRATVFTAAFFALALMTAISGVIGHALPRFFSPRFSALIAGALFLFFGINLLREGMTMEKDAGVEEEMEEVENEINATSHNEDLELGLRDAAGTASAAGSAGASEKSAAPVANPPLQRTPSNPRISGDGLDTIAGDASLYVPRPRRNNSGIWSGILSSLKRISEGLSNLFGLILSPIWVQIFAMTFFAEWGDRSQVTTIAMAAGSDYWWVIIGSVFGHAVCTASAVIGGKLLATRITLRNVTLTGSLLFTLFSLIYFWEFLSS